MRSVKLRKLTYGRPEIIIRNGRIIREAMHKNRFTLDELMQELRAQGLTDTAQVEYAVLETNGQLSIILKCGNQPATASQMGVDADDVSYAHIIINEGRILDNNLKLLGRDRRWLANELKRQNLRSADEVYILTLSENGSVFCQAKEA